MREVIRTGGVPAARCAALLWAFSFLFAVRVLGQALQRWAPQSFLPSFGEFQGSALPYWFLLSAQVLILAAMTLISWRVQAGMLAPSPRVASVLAWAGGIYMTVSLARIAVGLAVPAAPDWFRTWIPAVYHVVLAGFVLTLGVYHRRALRFVRGEAQQ